MSVNFRLATPADYPRIVEIYNQAILTKGSTADLELTTVASRQKWFAEFSDDHFPLWVMVEADQILGYVGLEPYSDRLAYAQTAEIALYLASEAQGHHLGGQAVEWAENAGKTLGITTIISRIFGHNHASCHLFERQGYDHWGHLPAIADMQGFTADLEVYGKHLTD